MGPGFRRELNERRINGEPNVASWNQIAGWLKQLDSLRRRHLPA
jgi:hypothetical protein